MQKTVKVVQVSEPINAREWAIRKGGALAEKHISRDDFAACAALTKDFAEALEYVPPDKLMYIVSNVDLEILQAAKNFVRFVKANTEGLSLSDCGFVIGHAEWERLQDAVDAGHDIQKAIGD